MLLSMFHVSKLEENKNKLRPHNNRKAIRQKEKHTNRQTDNDTKVKETEKQTDEQTHRELNRGERRNASKKRQPVTYKDNNIHEISMTKKYA